MKTFHKTAPKAVGLVAAVFVGSAAFAHCLEQVAAVNADLG